MHGVDRKAMRKASDGGIYSHPKEGAFWPELVITNFNGTFIGLLVSENSYTFSALKRCGFRNASSTLK